MLKQLMFILLFFISININAAPLKVAVPVHAPPFVFQTAPNQFYGFDITLAQYICKSIERPCEFKATSFADVIKGVSQGTADIGLGVITINPERAKQVSLSIPYLPSFCQFMTLTEFPKRYDLTALRSATIGYVDGEYFSVVLSTLGVKSKPKAYQDQRTLIQALIHHEVDIIIMDEPIVNYWVKKASSTLKVFGKPFKYGQGVAVAIDPNQPQLIDQINKALTNYLNSKQFHLDYDTYLQPTSMMNK